jgi:hypothetical protein
MLKSEKINLFIFFVAIFLPWRYAAAHPYYYGWQTSSEDTTLWAEGFQGDDVLVTLGYGVSTPGLKTNLQKDHAARNAARIDALRRALEICGGYGLADASEFTRSDLAKDIVERMKDARIESAKCRLNGDLLSCRIWLRIRNKNIRRDCKTVAVELAK